MYKQGLKRVIDFILALFLFILCMPLFLVLAILIYGFLGWPIVFTQLRPGLHGQVFKIIKFRSMNNARDSEGNLLPDAQRLTRFGKFLRRTSLDELPELWNVLKGDMSFVGPRPLLVDYLPLYNDEQRRRHEVRPGITGWAQVNGRNSISWADKFGLDVWYVDHLSFGLDLRILAITFLKVLCQSGINQRGQVTMEKFNGRN